jgi:hypothetical protein
MSTTTTPRKARKDPLATDAGVARLVAQFEAGTLPQNQWTHRAHLAVAATYLRAFTFPDALARVRERIQLFNNRCGPREGYHETITTVFMRAVAAYLEARPFGGVAEALPELTAAYDMAWLKRFYSAEALASDAAKAGWVEPDLGELEY